MPVGTLASCVGAAGGAYGYVAGGLLTVGAEQVGCFVGTSIVLAGQGCGEHFGGGPSNFGGGPSDFGGDPQSLPGPPNFGGGLCPFPLAPLDMPAKSLRLMEDSRRFWRLNFDEDTEYAFPLISSLSSIFAC